MSARRILTVTLQVFEDGSVIEESHDDMNWSRVALHHLSPKGELSLVPLSHAGAPVTAWLQWMPDRSHWKPEGRHA